jgi:hypothetical protein
VSDAEVRDVVLVFFRFWPAFSAESDDATASGSPAAVSLSAADAVVRFFLVVRLRLATGFRVSGFSSVDPVVTGSSVTAGASAADSALGFLERLAARPVAALRRLRGSAVPESVFAVGLASPAAGSSASTTASAVSACGISFSR